jgi:hypothetical protein
MTDMAGHGRPQPDDDQHRHTLTVREVGARLLEAGVPRSERQIKRYAETGFLDAKKVPGPTGEQWFVAPAALPKLIGDLQQWQAQRAGHSRPNPAVSGSGQVERDSNGDVDTASHGRPEQAAAEGQGRAGEPGATAYVGQLERRIEEKDQFIDLLKGQLVTKDRQLTDLSQRFTSLSDRFADTQKLMGAMQRMLAPLLGQSDPYAAAAEREIRPGSGEAVDKPEERTKQGL